MARLVQEIQYFLYKLLSKTLINNSRQITKLPLYLLLFRMADDLIEDGEIVDDIFDVISSDDEDLRSIKDKMAFFEAQNKEIELIEHISQGK